MFSCVRSGAAASLAALALLIAGCGGGTATSSGNADATRPYTDVQGTAMTIPAHPTRVLPLSEPTLDATLALGLHPVATTAGRGQNAIPSYLQSRTKGIRSVGTLGSPNLEQVAELAPDVILLDGTAFQDPAVVDKLRQIAPTVYVSKTGQDWKTAFGAAADVLGQRDRGAKVLAGYTASVAAGKTAIAAHARDTVSIVRWGGIGLPAVLMKELCAGRVLSDLGLPRPTFQSRTGPGHSVPVSLERIEDLDADWIFFGALGAGGPDGGAVDTPADVAAAKTAIETARDTPGWTGLRAVKDDHVVPVDGSAWTSAGGPIAAGIVVADVARTLGA
ncbi:MAG: iron-siderophore ABC transporter substrate-binding protein [Patulibacter sp.]|nr:iron-siderophore ABC transporter substrate-binding protein [Patulibacter sp.]